MREWMTAEELAGLRPNAAVLKALGMRKWPETVQGINKRAALGGWEGRKVGSSKAWEYRIASLPAPAQKALAAKALTVASKNVPAQLSLDLPAATDLKDHQRKRMDARAALLGHIDQLVIIRGISQGQAINALVELAARGELDPELQKLIPVANARSNDGRALTRATVYNWLKARQQAQGNVVALAPKAAPVADAPVWVSTFAPLYFRPSGPGIAEVLDQWPAGLSKPSYDQVRRFLKRVDPITRNTGRLGPKALQQFKAYICRDTSELWPGAVFIGDGHTCKWEVAHPIHGQPFRPELTAILDVYTRRWVGWSAALAENTWSVADALRYAACNATNPAIFYYDNGTGAKNSVWDDDVTGLVARLSITKEHSAPWSSQARGIVERFNSSTLHRIARQKPSYVGNRMDDEARRRAFKISRKEIKEFGASRIIPGWGDFLDCIDAEMHAYNNRPHSALPKIIDPETGKRRPVSPNEMWALAIAEGWTPDPVSPEEARDLFRPSIRRKVHRAIVSFLGNEYFAAELEPFHGEEVIVGYDIHDASKVWIRALDGRFICEAIWGGNKRSYFPISKVQEAEQKRVEGKLRRLRGHMAVAEAERHHGLLVDGSAEPFATLPAAFEPRLVSTLAERQPPIIEADCARLETKMEEANPGAATTPEGRPSIFGDDASWARWVLANPDEALEADRHELRRKLRSRTFRELMEMQGLDVGALSALAA